MKKRRIVFTALAVMTIAVHGATAETYTVNTSSDNIVANACANHLSNCSLRGAITAANANPGSTIVFGIVEFCPVSGCTISLLSPLPDITASMSISPTSHVIQRSSSASTNFRIFAVTTSGTVSFTGLTIAKGTLSAAGGGAGIQNLNGGTVNVTNCIVRDNLIIGPGFGSGAGISNSGAGILNITNSTFTGNSNFIGTGGAIS